MSKIPKIGAKVKLQRFTRNSSVPPSHLFHSKCPQHMATIFVYFTYFIASHNNTREKLYYSPLASKLKNNKKYYHILDI